MPSPELVWIIDDDQSIRWVLDKALAQADLHTCVFDSAEAALAKLAKAPPSAILTDIRMPGMDGLTLQKHLAQLGCELPVIIMTGHGDVASAREAFRAFAVDFLEKPLDHRKLLAAIADAFSRQRTRLVAEMNRSDIERLLARLTPREREVMARVVAGQHNRDIAAELGISARTVEVHKARMMDKLGVNNVADLVRLNLELPS